MLEELRIREWVDKLLLIAAGIFILSPDFFLSWNMILMAIFLVSIEVYIYLLNSYCDRDRKIFSLQATKAIIIGTGILSLVIPIILDYSFITVSLTIVTLFLSTSYSMPPFRLKGRGIMGLSGALAHYVMPFLVFCSIISIWSFTAITLVIYLIILSALKLVVHQVQDFDIDRKNNINTIVVMTGRNNGRLISFLLVGIIIAYFFLMILFLDGGILTSIILLFFSIPAYRYTWVTLHAS